jgi:hypothetical protein
MAVTLTRTKVALGLAFNIDRTKVFVVELNRPESRKGKLSYLSAVVDAGNDPLQELKDYFYDLAGLVISNWTPSFRIMTAASDIHCYTTNLTDAQIAQITSGDTAVGFLDLQDALCRVFTEKSLPSLMWILGMCLDPDVNSDAVVML